jgi:hypothetical protein
LLHHYALELLTSGILKVKSLPSTSLACFSVLAEGDIAFFISLVGEHELAASGLAPEGA